VGLGRQVSGSLERHRAGFAATATPQAAAKIKDIPCWCFQGAKDGKADVGKRPTR